jgi:hypothetical protein
VRDCWLSLNLHLITLELSARTKWYFSKVQITVEYLFTWRSLDILEY